MKIFYFTKAQLPTKKAYGVNMVKTCQALARQGIDVTLVVPSGRNVLGSDIFSYYGIEKNFTVHYVSIFDAASRGWKCGFWINHLLFTFYLLLTRYPKNKKENIILTRDEISGLLLAVRGYSVFYDMHGFPEHKLWFWKVIMKKMRGIITTNRWKIQRCLNDFNIPEKKMVVAPNGFDPELFSFKESNIELRKSLQLPKNEHIVMYTGHLYDWKGASVLLGAASLCQKSIVKDKIFFIFVGGTPWDVEIFKKKAKKMGNVMILGHKAYCEIPKYLKAADVLVLPNSQFSKQKRYAVYSKKDTSPIKMFEYMASGTPIVASKLSSIGEMLNNTNAVLVEPDNPKALSAGILELLRNTTHAQKISVQAKEDVKAYTWEKRAQRIINFINDSLALDR